MTHLVENKSDESLEKINNKLNQSDLVPHPFHSTFLGDVIREITNSRSRHTATPPLPDSDVPIEVQKRREAAAAGKPFIIPDWWRGEDANYKVAQVMMKTVPRDIGPLKE